MIDFDLKITDSAEAAENIYWLAKRGVRLDLEGDGIKIRGPQEQVTPTVKAVLAANKDLVKEALTKFYHTRWVEPLFLEPPYAWPAGAWPITLYFEGKYPVLFFDLDQLLKVVRNPATQPAQAELIPSPTTSYYSQASRGPF